MAEKILWKEYKGVKENYRISYVIELLFLILGIIIEFLILFLIFYLYFYWKITRLGVLGNSKSKIKFYFSNSWRGSSKLLGSVGLGSMPRYIFPISPQILNHAMFAIDLLTGQLFLLQWNLSTFYTECSCQKLKM